MRYTLWITFIVVFAMTTKTQILAVESITRTDDNRDATSKVRVEIFENIDPKKRWDLSPEPTDAWEQDCFAWTALPRKYIRGGLIADRSNPFIIRASTSMQIPSGEYVFLLRAKNIARLSIDGTVVIEHTVGLPRNADGHEEVPQLPDPVRPGHCPPPSRHHELTERITLTDGCHEIRVESIVGGPSLRAELGELCVAIAAKDEPTFHVVTTNERPFPLTTTAWQQFKKEEFEFHHVLNTQWRREKLAMTKPFWQRRHETARKLFADATITPPDVGNFRFVNNAIDQFIVHQLEQRSLRPTRLVEDLQFIRRLTLDTVGQVPSVKEIRQFLADERPDRRSRLIDKLLEDPRWADHWVPYWQDVLAENPNILKASLNNTGPFRWWIHESFLDNKPIDQFVTDLILMKGSKYDGGPAGFELATQNDVPEANKALIVAEAFLATNMNCARCHDSPVNDVTQKQLFGVAAMLSRKAIALPETSTVIVAENGRQPLIDVSLHPGDLILPKWPLGDLAQDSISADMVEDPSDSREWLAAIITSPANERFAQVIVNRLWHRYLGRGLVEPIDDWSDATCSHPDLLRYLARQLVTHDYDLKHVARLILNSQTYQRQRIPEAEFDDSHSDKEQWFAAAVPRRMTAEQLFDSLFAITEKPVHAEPLTMDPEGRRPIKSFLNLRTPRKAWQFSSLSNERDRPALSLPVDQSVNDLLKAYGWREARQDALTVRDKTMTPIQPLVLANGIIGRRIVGLSDDHAVTELCLQAKSTDEIADWLFLAFFTRHPTADERIAVNGLLKDGFESRIVQDAAPVTDTYRWQRHAVSWSNHLHPKASDIMLALEQKARQADPPTLRLDDDWRKQAEDVLWAIVNSPEFVFIP